MGSRAPRNLDSPYAVRSPGRARTGLAGSVRAFRGHVTGTVRVDERTKRLVGRIQPGDIAVIDHEDLDRVAAESLLERGVAAVVNARRSISGRYPNLGPLVLVRAGVLILDDVGAQAFAAVQEGMIAKIEDARLYVGEQLLGSGTPLDEKLVRERMDQARAKLSETVEAFAENTLDYVKREQHLLLESLHLPSIRTCFKGRHALVVTRGHHYKDDLRHLKTYVREMRPVVVAVDGASDACLAEGIVPDCIVGDMDSVSLKALGCGAELFVHPQGDWRRAHHAGDEPDDAPEVAALREMGLEAHVITGHGTSEDVAMLLAYEHGAELIVAVGSHTSAIEMLDKGRKGMASTFLVRLRIGPSLVDAKGVSQLYGRQTIPIWGLVAMLIAALLTTAIIAAVISRPLRLYGISMWELVTQTVFRIRSWF